MPYNDIAKYISHKTEWDLQKARVKCRKVPVSGNSLHHNRAMILLPPETH